MYEDICPRCGKTAVSNDGDHWFCYSCALSFEDDDDDEDEYSEELSASDAAYIWKSYGEDEDYMIGYCEDELEEAFYR